MKDSGCAGRGSDKKKNGLDLKRAGVTGAAVAGGFVGGAGTSAAFGGGLPDPENIPEGAMGDFADVAEDVVAHVGSASRGPAGHTENVRHEGGETGSDDSVIIEEPVEGEELTPEELVDLESKLMGGERLDDIESDERVVLPPEPDLNPIEPEEPEDIVDPDVPVDIIDPTDPDSPWDPVTDPDGPVLPFVPDDPIDPTIYDPVNEIDDIIDIDDIVDIEIEDASTWEDLTGDDDLFV